MHSSMARGLAVAAVAGLGLAGLATTAHADTPTASPRATSAPVAKPTPRAAGDWAVAVAAFDIAPKSLKPVAGTEYTLTGTVRAGGIAAQATFSVSYNADPAGGDVHCTATGANGAVASEGRITWTDVAVESATTDVKADYTITCRYVRDHSGAINEKVVLNAPGHVFTGDITKLVDSYTSLYTVGGVLPTATPTGSTTPKPTTSATLTLAPKSPTGLAKTGH